MQWHNNYQKQLGRQLCAALQAVLKRPTPIDGGSPLLPSFGAGLTPAAQLNSNAMATFASTSTSSSGIGNLRIYS